VDLIPSTPFVLTLPANATVNSAGEVVADLTPAGSGAALDDLSNVTPATGRAALGVPATTAADLKADVHVFGPVVIDVDGASDHAGFPLFWRPGFAGTITRVSANVVVAGVTAAGGITAEVSINEAQCTLSAPLSFPIGSGTQDPILDVAVTAGGAFTADQLLGITNTTAALLSIVLEYTRA
jgi:hypothetical protein